MTESPLRVLIAEDNPSDRLLLHRLLVRLGHLVVEAEDGEQAVAQFHRERPDLVLLDVLMPRLDGREAARQIKQAAGDTLVPIIFLTSLEDAQSLAGCLEAGGDDFLSKPYNGIILSAKLDAFRRMLGMHRTLQEQRDEIGRRNQRLLEEQLLARRVFDRIAHASGFDPPNLRYAASPLAVFNGDVMLSAVSPSGQLLILLGDFTGHGLSAAIGSLPLAQAFYTMVGKGFALREILQEVNAKLYLSLPVEIFCCAVVASFDFTAGRLEVWNGGVPDGILYRAADGCQVPLTSRHLPLGVVPAEEFDSTPEIHGIRPGDRFFFWSDGFLELRDAHGEGFGEERIESVFRVNREPSRLFSELNLAINQFVGEDAQSDDFSLLEIEVVPPEVLQSAVAETGQVAVGHRADWSLNFELGAASLAGLDPLPVLVHILREVPPLRARGVDLHTILAELYNNALEHGLLALDSRTKDSAPGFQHYYRERRARLAELEAGSVRFEICCRAEGRRGCLQITVRDSGPGFARGASPLRPPYSGRGLELLERLCDRVEYNCAEGEVSVEVTWGEPGTGPASGPSLRPMALR